MQLEEQNLEFRWSTNDSWYSVTLHLFGNNLIVLFNDDNGPFPEFFWPEMFGTLSGLRRFKARFREQSIQLRASQCSEINSGTEVCAARHFRDGDVRFYDAEVDSVQNAEHFDDNGNEKCPCKFRLLWQRGPLKGSITPTGITDLRLKSNENLQNQKLDAFLDMVVQNILGEGFGPRGEDGEYDEIRLQIGENDGNGGDEENDLNEEMEENKAVIHEEKEDDEGEENKAPVQEDDDNGGDSENNGSDENHDPIQEDDNGGDSENNGSDENEEPVQEDDNRGNSEKDPIQEDDDNGRESENDRSEENKEQEDDENDENKDDESEADDKNDPDDENEKQEEDEADDENEENKDDESVEEDKNDPNDENREQKEDEADHGNEENEDEESEEDSKSAPNDENEELKEDDDDDHSPDKALSPISAESSNRTQRQLNVPGPSGGRGHANPEAASQQNPDGRRIQWRYNTREVAIKTAKGALMGACKKPRGPDKEDRKPDSN